MAATSQDQPDKPAGAAFTSRQLRLLKIAVIVMGITLVGGFILVVGTIVYQAFILGESDAPPAATTKYGALVPDAALSLEPGQSVSHVALDGSRMAVHLAGPRGSEIRVIDLTTGATVSRIRLKSE